jgi:DivIVA domain-containing protein
MPLTPEDVSNKRFTPVRLREGYDMGEVDQFLDEVETELERLIKENDDLRTKLSAAQRGEGDRSPLTTSPVAEKAPEPAREPVREPEPEPVRGTTTTAFSGTVQEIKVTTVAEASSAAAKLLEIATRNSEEIVTEAKDEADRIVGAARTKSERLESETKSKADRMESDARSRAQMLDAETEARRRELFGNLEKDKVRLDQEIENLRAFEREYRSRLKNYFTQQLSALDGNGSGGELPTSSQPAEHAPKRLRSILGEDDAGHGG